VAEERILKKYYGASHGKARVLPAEEGKDEREDHAQQNAGRDGEVKAEVVSLDVDVTRQTPQPEEGKEVGIGQDQTQNYKHESQQD